MRKLITIFFLISTAYGQSTIERTIGGWKSVVYLPAAYAANSNNADSSLHCFVFMYGAGESGSGLTYTPIYGYGPIGYKTSGWNGVVTLGSTNYTPILIGLQQNPSFAGVSVQPTARLDSIRILYKIKVQNLHVGGFSAGGQSGKIVMSGDTYDGTAPYGPFPNADAFGDMMDVEGVVPDDITLWYQNVRNFARNKVGGRFFGVWGTGDGDRSIPRLVDSLNSVVPGSGIVISTSDIHTTAVADKVYGSAGGTAPLTWSLDGKTQTYYQWAIRNGDTLTGNISPTTNAGSNQTITLPTSVITLTGSAADSDGTVSSVLWTNRSGPNTPTITSSNSTTTTVTGLVQGTYIFRLTATDNLTATGYSEVTVTVNAAPARAYFQSKRKFRN